MTKYIKFKKDDGSWDNKIKFPENYETFIKKFKEYKEDDINNYQLIEADLKIEIKNQIDYKKLKEKEGNIKIIINKIDNEKNNLNIKINHKMKNEINKNEIIDESPISALSITENEEKNEELSEKILAQIKNYMKYLDEEYLDELSDAVQDEITERRIKNMKKKYQLSDFNDNN